MSNEAPLFTRRHFLKTSATAAAAFSILPALHGAESPSNKIVVGVMGTSRSSSGGDGRGTELAVDFAKLPGVELRYICDADSRNTPKATESIMKKAKPAKEPKSVPDFRRILDDPEVDAIVIATPDHWHAPAAIVSCAARKHVYVEKPCSHNPREGELLVAAARKYQRVVQHGTQRRTWPALREAVEKLHSGVIGRISFGKGCYFGSRPTIGQGKVMPPPAWLDWQRWQGPAPERPYRDNIVHYNWHWFWHWGTGELGNNAVHYVDFMRWGMGLDLPITVTSSGGKYRYPEDDQETPDTNVSSFDFGNATITWEQRSWSPRNVQDQKHDMAFYGENGVLTITWGGYTITDLKGVEIGKGTGDAGNTGHLQNFVDTIRGKAKLNSDIEEGAKSALICHLANIAYRTGHTIHFDPKKSEIIGDKKARSFWSREYRKGWDLKV